MQLTRHADGSVAFDDGNGLGICISKQDLADAARPLIEQALRDGARTALQSLLTRIDESIAHIDADDTANGRSR